MGKHSNTLKLHIFPRQVKQYYQGMHAATDNDEYYLPEYINNYRGNR